MEITLPDTVRFNVEEDDNDAGFVTARVVCFGCAVKHSLEGKPISTQLTQSHYERCTTCGQYA